MKSIESRKRILEDKTQYWGLKELVKQRGGRRQFITRQGKDPNRSLNQAFEDDEAVEGRILDLKLSDTTDRRRDVDKK